MTKPMTNKEYMISVRMDRKLYAQLMRYASKNDNSMVSRSARKAIEMFLQENKL